MATTETWGRLSAFGLYSIVQFYISSVDTSLMLQDIIYISDNNIITGRIPCMQSTCSDRTEDVGNTYGETLVHP